MPCTWHRDLLDLANDNLVVSGDRLRGVVLQGAAELPVAGEAALVAALQAGLANRVVTATAMNAGPSQVLARPNSTMMS